MNDLVRITPESFDIANAYIQYGCNIQDTAEQLQIPKHEVARIIQTKQVKDYIDQVFLDMGYRNRDKLGKVLDKMIDSKLEEALDSGVYTGKDLLDLLQFAHKMRMDEIKANKTEGPSTAVQINNQYGDTQYGKLMERLLNGESN